MFVGKVLTEMDACMWQNTDLCHIFDYKVFEIAELKYT
jgi:hypothetical protein